MRLIVRNNSEQSARRIPTQFIVSHFDKHMASEMNDLLFSSFLTISWVWEKQYALMAHLHKMPLFRYFHSVVLCTFFWLLLPFKLIVFFIKNICTGNKIDFQVSSATFSYCWMNEMNVNGNGFSLKLGSANAELIVSKIFQVYFDDCVMNRSDIVEHTHTLLYPMFFYSSLMTANKLFAIARFALM